MITTLGPSGTYSELAAHKLYPDKEIILKESIFDIFANSQAGDVMVLPLENSTYGSVIDVWEAVVNKGLFISKTTTLPIVHSIGAQSSEFEVIFGHPQALGQCYKFLHDNYPNVKIEAATSTGAAIQKALDNTNTAAIGNTEVMRQKGLQIINENINDSRNNQTVFGVISNSDLYPNQPKSKTLIVVEPKVDRHGLLFSILETIEEQALNMTRLESRPQGNDLGWYKFFIDLQTAPDSPEFEKVFAKLGREHKVHIIGAY